MSEERIPSEEWETIVRNVPIVSVDLVVQSPDGIVLGKRTNEPAKGEWFVPGGRIHKFEHLTEAVDRLAREELNANEVTIEQSLGVYEHIYDTSDVTSSDGKHYFANGFVVNTDSSVADMTPDNQHENLRAFDPSDIPTDIHEYTAAYLRDANSIPYDKDL